MRIRTIKPEFWTHRKTGRLSFGAKCLAIGLLNLADDEGYFEADPILIRSALFAFTEPSVNVHGILTELSEISYIELRQNDEHGILVGCVCNFLKHQKISHPSDSKLKSYYDSGKPHGILTEDSVSRGRGSGNREQGKEQGNGTGYTPQPPKGGSCIVLSEDKYIQFWNQLPKLNRVGSGRTKEAWNKAIRNGAAPEDIIEGVEKLVRYERLRKQQDPNGYRPLHPSTWLNQERWDDGEEFESDQQPSP